MNDSERQELQQLKARQDGLQRQVSALGQEISALEQRLTSQPVPATNPAPIQPPVMTPPPLPPIIKRPAALATPAPVTPAASREFAPTYLQGPSPGAQKKIEPKAFTPEPAGPSGAPKESLELRVGTYWLVRVGAVLILTGLAFFGNLAYQQMGAGGKLALLYLASGVLLGAGTWWQRRAAKSSLHNFAQVLFAGGLAAVYFTTYAAHHVATLRVIESAVLDGALLLGWAAFIAWRADRRKSELLALFATGLAYYTSVITPVGAFTLYSNLVLTLAAVAFLVRNRWVTLSWASLVATYAGYGWWRFYHGGEGWRWATPDEGLAFGAAFLFAYWLIFTVAAFVSRHENLTGKARAAFVTFNNAALFSLFVLTLWQVDTGRFWQFSLGYGVMLLGLAELTRRFQPTESATKNTYLTQGLVLMTVGFVAKFTGAQLALILAAQSVILFLLGTLRRNIFLQTGAYLSGGLAVAWGLDTLDRSNPQTLWLGLALGGLMACNAEWSARRRVWNDPRPVRPEPGFFTALALIQWVGTTWYATTTANFPLALGGGAVLLTTSIYLLRGRELALLGQLLLLLAHLSWLVRFMDTTAGPTWWNALGVIAPTLLLSHWWQRQRAVMIPAPVSQIFQFLYAGALVTVLHTWLAESFGGGTWLALLGGLALGLTVYGALTRLWPLAAAAQIFILISIGQFAVQLLTGHPQWYFALAPIGTLLALSLVTSRWLARHPEHPTPLRVPLLMLARAYRWVALLLSLGWGHEYVPQPERPWAFALLGLVAFGIAGKRREREPLGFSAVWWVMALAAMWLLPQRDMVVSAPNFLIALALLGQQWVARRQPERLFLSPAAQHGMIVTGVTTLWWLLSQWVQLGPGGFYLTATWSLLALAGIGCGVVGREKAYRWMGFLILAAALGRIVVFDVWKLETLYRVLSFMALGVVLVVLGFIYNKYQDKFREWL